MPGILPRLATRPAHFGPRWRLLCLFAAVLAGVVLALIAGLYVGYERSDDTSALNAMLTGGIIAGFAIAIMLIGVWRLLDEHVAKPVEELAGEFRSRSHAHITAGLADKDTRHLGDLVPAATTLLHHLNHSRNELAEAVERETTQQAIEKENLIQLIAELPVGVVLCTADHRVVLYNGPASALLGQHEGHSLCLDQRLLDDLQATPIPATYERLLQSNDTALPFDLTLHEGHIQRRLSGSMRLIDPPPQPSSPGYKPGYVLMLHKNETMPSVDGQLPRALVYDFELLFRDRGAPFAETRLENLVYVVFDTETTGLLPASGDQIVQLAAVRIVNGRRVENEVIDELVHPGRPIPTAATRIHGISDAMVADAPRIPTIAKRLHKFAQGAVLVAHNANFDMAFLRRTEPLIGLRFENPVLDTVLLSALAFGDGANHSLDALTARLDVPLTEEARHTAMGDATATAEVLLKLLPALRARGIVTFGDLEAATRRHSRVLG